MATADNNQNYAHSQKELEIEPTHTQEIKVLDYKAEQKYWKRNIKLTLFPLLICGIPVHLFLIKNKKITEPTAVSSWASFLLKTSVSKWTWLLPLNLLYLLFAICLNGLFLLYIYGLVTTLLVAGEWRAIVVENITALFQGIIVVVGVDLVWLYGYLGRDVLRKLFGVRLPAGVPPSDPPLARLSLVGLYAALGFLHGLHGLRYGRCAEFNGLNGDRIAPHWIEYLLHTFLATLLFPVLVNIGWALKRHFKLLGGYLRGQDAGTLQVLQTFKLAFKGLADIVQDCNACFSAYFSWAVIVLLFSINVELRDFLIVIYNAEGTEDGDFWSPRRTRAFVAFLTLLTVKLGLIWYAAQELRRANDAAKYLLVDLNDFVGGAEGRGELSTDAYQAFRVLKYYVESRLRPPKASLFQVQTFNWLAAVLYGNLNAVFLAFANLLIFLQYFQKDDETKGVPFGFNMLKAPRNSSYDAKTGSDSAPC